MRHRVGRAVPPPELLVFDGRELTTYEGWCAAFDAWCSARKAWEAEHPGVVLAEGRVLSECPLESLLPPHGGAWSRPKGERELRCREHGLRPDEH